MLDRTACQTRLQDNYDDENIAAIELNTQRKQSLIFVFTTVRTCAAYSLTLFALKQGNRMLGSLRYETLLESASSSYMCCLIADVDQPMVSPFITMNVHPYFTIKLTASLPKPGRVKQTI